jgi:hypothetical protein
MLGTELGPRTRIDRARTLALLQLMRGEAVDHWPIQERGSNLRAIRATANDRSPKMLGRLPRRYAGQHRTRHTYRCTDRWRTSVPPKLAEWRCLRSPQRSHIGERRRGEVEPAASATRTPDRRITEDGFTHPRGILQHGGEHWLKIAGRAAYNLKNLGRSSLLLKCFS